LRGGDNRGVQIGGYRLGPQLGEGASGVVYSARDAAGEHVAVKILRTERDDDPVARARFRREAELAAEIDSRHVAPILELGESEGRTYLVLAFYPGGSLAARLRNDGALPLPDVVDIAAQLGRGLDALHQHDILHRDVKPSNVLLDGEGVAALSDFGLARTPGSTRLTEDGQILGTPHYLAPELIEGRDATRASDVYALGCVLYECLVGRPPFEGRSPAEVGFAHLVERAVDPGELRPRLPPGVGAAVLNAMAKDPQERATSATALARMLHVASTAVRS
jgi:serine/threonine protein kinase